MSGVDQSLSFKAVLKPRPISPQCTRVRGGQKRRFYSSRVTSQPRVESFDSGISGQALTPAHHDPGARMVSRRMKARDARATWHR